MVPAEQARCILSEVYSPTSWKVNSRKVVCRMVHSPARWPPYGRPETSRLLKVAHYMLHVRTEMRSDQYAAPRQDDDTGEGYQELRPPAHYQRYGLPDMGVYISRFEGRYICSGPQ